MKKLLVPLLASGFLFSVTMLASAATAKPAAKEAPKATPKPAPAPIPQAKPAASKTKSVNQIESMQPGFAFNGGIDIKIFDMINAGFLETSDWYFYPVYRLQMANVFDKQNFGLFADLEKPGYANITYPFIKVNELYAKFQQDTFYVKLGRQVFGDKDDLLLGLQNDAISVGFDLGKTDLLFFLARTQILAPWNTGGNIESVIGFVPTFTLGDTMGLRGYLLIGMEPITITTGTPPNLDTEDSVNTIIHAGGKYALDMPAGPAANFGLDAQLGVQFGMAKTAADDSIDAMGLGMKLDAEYASQLETFGFAVGGHIVYTSGDPDPLVNTKCGFASSNALPGSGPGLFSKIQDGAGPYTYLDGHLVSPKIQNYAGVMAIGVTGEISFQTVTPGLGLWIYSNTDDEGESLGTELDEWVVWRMSDIVSFYQEAALFIPNRDGIGWPPSPADAPKSAVKLMVGSAIQF
ncbi:hypothetical protein JW933_00330 [candidate division FCPU426 bacterium]|nr:hypothetical protein [candidate division FCPU426 bacterium]